MKQSITEKKLTPNELKNREEVIKKLKANRSSLVKRYGKDAEKVMYGRATNIAKKTAENMNKDKVREMIKKTLMSPVEEKFSKEYDNDPSLKGKQKSLPDALQKAIISKGMKEDIDLGHQDDEPDMLKATVYRIAQYAVSLYKMLDKYDQMDQEVDFPDWWQEKIHLAADYMDKTKHYLEFEEKQPALDSMIQAEVEEAKDAVDTITMDVPLFIRMLEYAREDASTDVDLHDVAEKAIEINKDKETLSMQDYESIVPVSEEPMNEDISEKYVVWIDIDGKGKKLMHTLNSKEQAKKVGQQVYNRYFDDYNTKVGMMPLSQWEKEPNKIQEALSDIDTLKTYVAKYTDDVDKEISKYKFAGFQAFSEPVKIGLKSDMDFITWVQMKHDEDQLRREKGI